MVAVENTDFIPLHYTLLTFFQFEQHIFAEFTNYFNMLTLINWELFLLFEPKILENKIPSNRKPAKQHYL